MSTGLFYVGSRYYDPTTGRFLNADSVAGKVGDLLGANVFAYCMNNPVNMSDPSGHWPNWNKVFSATNCIIAGVVVLGVAATILSGGTAAPLAAALIGWSMAAVGAGCITYGAAEAYESCTGYNPIRDGTLGGNQQAYDTSKAALLTVASASSLGGGIVDAVANASMSVGASTAGKTIAGEITGYTKHGINQMISRNGVGMSPAAILNTLRNPSNISSSIDSMGRLAYKYEGEQGVIIFNDAGKIISGWAKSSEGWRIH